MKKVLCAKQNLRQNWERLTPPNRVQILTSKSLQHHVSSRKQVHNDLETSSKEKKQFELIETSGLQFYYLLAFGARLPVSAPSHGNFSQARYYNSVQSYRSIWQPHPAENVCLGKIQKIFQGGRARPMTQQQHAKSLLGFG